MQEKTFVIQGSDFQVRIYESLFRMTIYCSMIEYTREVSTEKWRDFLYRFEATATSHKDFFDNSVFIQSIRIIMMATICINDGESKKSSTITVGLPIECFVVMISVVIGLQHTFYSVTEGQGSLGICTVVISEILLEAVWKLLSRY